MLNIPMGMFNGTRLYAGIVYTGIGNSTGDSDTIGNINSLGTSIAISNGTSDIIGIINSLGTSIGISNGTSNINGIIAGYIKSLFSSTGTSIVVGNTRQIKLRLHVYRYNTIKAQLYRI